MTVITSANLAEWCRGPFCEQPEHIRFDGKGFYFTHPEAACIKLQLPAGAERLPRFARWVLAIGHQESQFEGALLFFSEWGVWDQFEEGIGYRIVERMNAAAGQPSSFEAAPGHEYRADELPDAIGALLQPMIFSWDAYCVPHWNGGQDDFFVFVSHDSYILVVTRTKEFYDLALKDLEALRLEPKPVEPADAARFRRLRSFPR